MRSRKLIRAAAPFRSSVRSDGPCRRDHAPLADQDAADIGELAHAARHIPGQLRLQAAHLYVDGERVAVGATHGGDQTSRCEASLDVAFAYTGQPRGLAARMDGKTGGRGPKRDEEGRRVEGGEM